MADSFDVSEYLGIFLDEADEQIGAIDEGLLRLEKEPNNSELIQGVFRAAHSLKSSSAAMGFACMSRLTHAAETVLDAIREGRLRPETGVVDALLAAVDALKEMKAAIRGGGDDQRDVAAVLAALEAAGPAGSKPAQGEQGRAPAEPGRLRQSQAPDEKGAAGGCCRVVVRLDADCGMPSVRWHMALSALDAVGQVVSCQPTAEQVEAGELGREFEVVVAAEGGEWGVRRALEAVSEIERVEVSEGGAEEDDWDPLRPQPPRPGDERSVDVGVEGRGRPASEIAAMASRAEQTVRVHVWRLDSLMNLVGELVIDRTRVMQIGRDIEARFGNVDLVRDLKETSLHMSRTVADLQENVMKARLLPIAQLFRRFPRMVRDLSQKTGKEVELLLEGEETELDRSVIEEMVDPLGHLLRNAVDHGIERPREREMAGKPRAGRIILGARQQDNHIVIELTDDGAGIDVARVREAAVSRGVIPAGAAEGMSEEEALQLVFAPGLSTSAAVSDVSGRGVGMDVVRSNVSRLHGAVRIRTKRGLGTTVTVRLPLTLAISQALLVGSGRDTIAIPLVYVAETVRAPVRDVRTIGGRLAMRYRDRVLPLVHVREALGERAATAAIIRDLDLLRVVVARSHEVDVGLIVEALLGEQEIVLKSLGSGLGELPGLSGATILGDGTVALVLDVASLMEHASMEAAALDGPRNGAAEGMGDVGAV